MCQWCLSVSLGCFWAVWPIILAARKSSLPVLRCTPLACIAFALEQNFPFYLCLLGLCGLSIGLFKTGALALIGDVSHNAEGHTRLMNRVEGFFGLGAIFGPGLVSLLIAYDMAWTQLYLLAGFICAVLLVLAYRLDYPEYKQAEQSSVFQSLKLVKDPYALGFSLAIAFYVAAEVAIFVWLPTLLQQYQGNWTFFAANAIMLFFILRTAGRFLAEWLLSLFDWALLLACFGTAIFGCFALSMLNGVDWALWLMPLSGLFMAMMYPTLNSKGISCFERSQHGAAAGLDFSFYRFSCGSWPIIDGHCWRLVW